MQTHKTYWNAKNTCNYPFHHSVTLPFGKNCIQQLSVCIRSDDTSDLKPVYASSIAITKTGIMAVLEQDGETLGIITVAISDKKAGHLAASSGVTASGFMLIGTISDSDVGVYNGMFLLDPSCVLRMPYSVFGTVSKVQVNGQTYTAAQSVELATSGDIEKSLVLNGSTAASLYVGGSTSAFLNSSFIEYSNELANTPVIKLNALDLTGNTNAMTLYIHGNTSTQGKVLFKVTDTNKLTILEITGTTAFPNCYGSNDQAAQDT